MKEFFHSQANSSFSFYKSYPVGTLSNQEPHNKTRIEKVHLKCGCIDESKVNGSRKSILFF